MSLFGTMPLPLGKVASNDFQSLIGVLLGKVASNDFPLLVGVLLGKVASSGVQLLVGVRRGKASYGARTRGLKLNVK